MELVCCPLYSGSSGNAFYVEYGDTRILVDCGKSGKQTEEALNYIGVKPDQLSGILVTHEHRDHIGGIGVMSRKYHLPVYATERTWEAIGDKVGSFARGMQRIFSRDEDFYLGRLGVAPFATSHDAAEPCGFRLIGGNTSVAVATDLGYMPKETIETLSGVDMVLLESNHDPALVQCNEHYTRALKDRILGRRGHLSNQDCADAILALADKGVRYFILGHLSHENNRPELAMQTSVCRLELEGVEPGKDVFLDLAWRDRVGNRYRISADHAWQCVS